MKAMEIIAGFSTGDTTALTALTAATGNSFTIRAAPFESKVHLLTLWGYFQAAGQLQIRSPRMHDNVRGLRYSLPATDGMILLDPRFKVPLVPQDTLVIEADGGAAAGDIAAVCAINYYEDLGGSAARLVDAEYVALHAKSVVTVENTITMGTAGNWGGEEALNIESDLLKANTDYALVGYTNAVACIALRWRGADTGNYGVGGPGHITSKHLTSRWFEYLSERSGLPCIPVFNSANKAGILVDGFQDETGNDAIVTSIFVELE